MSAEFSVGQHIGDYEVLSILGAGGMGKVYKVRNVIADRVEAMKVLLPDLNASKSLADRFLREIRLLATLNHPNIAALRTALTFENQLVMVMEFVEGETLSNRLARAPLSTAETVNYADQVLSALGYAHKQNIIHRDIKPANMMLTPQGSVKLMDFGIARSSTDGTITSTGTTLGSLNYMPPEQVRGEAADARSDIYSFGVSLYEMLTGKLPFQSDSQYSLMTAHLNQTPPAPITLRGDLPPALNEIIMMAMAKDRENRFQSADAFRAALKSVPVTETPASDIGSTLQFQSHSGATTLMDTPAPRPAPAAAAATVHTPAQIPTVPMAPPAPAAAPQMPPPATRSSGSRGVWLALGALLGIGVLATAAVYVPRHFGTHADPNKAAFPQKNALDTSSTTSTPETPAPPTDTSNASTPAVNVETPQGSLKVDSSGNVSVQTPTGSLQVDSSTGSVTVTKGATGEQQNKKDRSAGNPVPARAATSTDNQQPQTNATPAPPPGPSQEEIAKVEDEADKLNIRAAAASHSVDTLRKQQLAAGYNLRADIAASQERMQLYLEKGNRALNAQDLKNAQKYFEQADAELSKLEKFLGH